MGLYFQAIKQTLLLSKRVNTLIFKVGSHFIHRASQMDFCWSEEGRTMSFPSHDKDRRCQDKNLATLTTC